MKIGLIQTRGIGDIIIAAPIAQYYINQGHEVFWPVDSGFYPAVQAAFPEIRFMPVSKEQAGGTSLAYFYAQPLAELSAIGCNPIFSLYSYLSGLDIVDPKQANSLKFDEYKYAAASVPFEQKWQLRVNRNLEREQALFERLDIRGDYILMHDQGSNFKLDIQLPEDMLRDFQLVRVSELSDNPFDWIGVIERAGVLVCVDSCFANLAEQLNLCARKYLFLRSDIRATPVFKNNWQFR